MRRKTEASEDGIGMRPSEAGPARMLATAVWVFAVVATLFFSLYWFRHIGPRPQGIVGLEVAGTAEDARELLRKWGDVGQAAALSTIRWDWVFIGAYVWTIAGLCVWGSNSLSHAQGKVALRCAMVVVVFAGLVDVVENFFLLKLIDGPVTGGRATAASTLAGSKFILIALGLLFGLATSLYRITLAIEQYLKQGSREGPSDPFRTQLLSSEQTRDYAPAPQLIEGTWRSVLGWLIALPADAPVAAAGGAPKPDPDDKALVGVCCSGGGIRSAAYNLGVFQALRERGVLGEADYVAAVSGGSYIAASQAVVTAKTAPPLLQDQYAYHPESPEAAYLLNHSAYLGPPGIAGKLWMIVRTLMGIAVNVGFLSAVIFLVGRPLGWWYRGLHPHLLEEPVQLSVRPWMWAVIGIPAAFGVLLVLGDLLSNPVDRVFRLVRAWYVRFINVGLVLFMLLIGLPYLVEVIRLARLRELPLGHLTLPTAGVGGLLVGAIQGFFAKRRRFLAMLAGGLIGPLMLLSLLVIFSREGLFAGFSSRELWVWLGVFLAFGVFYLFADLTSWSPHPFYKRALWSSFGLRRVSGPEGPVAQEIPHDRNVTLVELRPGSDPPPEPSRFPKLLICAAANVQRRARHPLDGTRLHSSLAPMRSVGQWWGRSKRIT